MLDIKFIRENADRVKFAIKNKKVKDKVDVDQLLKMHDTLKAREQELVEKRTEQNEITSQIQKAKDAAARAELIKKATNTKVSVQQLEKDLEAHRDEFTQVLLKVPNVVDPGMPVGESDEKNVVLRKVGNIPEFDFEPKDHVELGEALDLIEIDKAGKISGSRFYYLKNEAVLMQFGIIQLVMQTLSDRTVLGKIASQVGNPFDKIFVPIVHR